MGLAHSDLSYNNIWWIRLPNLHVSLILTVLLFQNYFPEVIGTADFIAPEVLKTKHLGLQDPQRFHPNQKTTCMPLQC
jgi:hypothetical protein